MDEIKSKVEKKGDAYIFRMSGAINAQTLPRYREVIDQLDVRCDHKVMFINVPEKFKEFLAIFKLEDSIAVYDSQEEAEKSLEG